jgi:hypothetical protein
MRSPRSSIGYNARKIHIHGDALRTRHYSGKFNARDPESFIDYLRQDDGIEIVDIQGGLVVTPHSSDTQFSHMSGHVAFQFAAFGF